MDVPRLGCLLALWQRSWPTNNSLDLTLLEVVHVDMDAIYAVWVSRSSLVCSGKCTFSQHACGHHCCGMSWSTIERDGSTSPNVREACGGGKRSCGVS